GPGRGGSARAPRRHSLGHADRDAGVPGPARDLRVQALGGVAGTDGAVAHDRPNRAERRAGRAVRYSCEVSLFRRRERHGAELGAFTLAETGLELFIARRDSFGFRVAPPAVTESTRIVLTGGYADVVLQQLRADATAQRWGYVVRSHGVGTVKALRGTPAAERTVAEYAVWQPATINILSSWTSLSGLHKNGGA